MDVNTSTHAPVGESLAGEAAVALAACAPTPPALEARAPAGSPTAEGGAPGSDDAETAEAAVVTPSFGSDEHGVAARASEPRERGEEGGAAHAGVVVGGGAADFGDDDEDDDDDENEPREYVFEMIPRMGCEGADEEEGGEEGGAAEGEAVDAADAPAPAPSTGDAAAAQTPAEAEAADEVIEIPHQEDVERLVAASLDFLERDYVATCAMTSGSGGGGGGGAGAAGGAAPPRSALPMAAGGDGAEGARPMRPALAAALARKPELRAKIEALRAAVRADMAAGPGAARERVESAASV
jgi:hypothetical protein